MNPPIAVGADQQPVAVAIGHDVAAGAPPSVPGDSAASRAVGRGGDLLANPGVAAVALVLTALSAGGIVSLVFLSPVLPGLAKVVLGLCGYDPLNGSVRAEALGLMLVQLYLFAIVVYVMYLEDIRRFWLRRRVLAIMAAMAFVLPIAGFGTAVVQGKALLSAPDGPPQDRAPLTLPAVTLTDQRGDAFDTGRLRGSVTLMTFIYADCAESCPLIVTEVNAVLERLPASRSSDLFAVALTLDPLRDTPEALAQAAERWHVTDPRFRLLTGSPGEVQRVVNSATLWRRQRGVGGWDHANLVLVLDRDGGEAYAAQGEYLDRDALLAVLDRLLRR